MVKTTVGGFPFSHWCINFFLVKHLSCRGGVLFFKNHPAKTESKIHRSSAFMFAFRILGSSKKMRRVHQWEASPSHTGVPNLVPSTPSLAEEVL